MNCNKVDHLIMKYMDGILTMEEAKHLNQHITKCDTCREEFLLIKNDRCTARWSIS